MDTKKKSDHHPVLETAWRQHAELDDNASILSKQHLKLRKWVIILGILATILAIITDGYSERLVDEAATALRIFLISAPLVASAVAAFTNRLFGDARWLAMRAGAEEIKKEIYMYRTVLSNYPDRQKWLSQRLATILRQVFKNSNNRLDTNPYKGKIPPYYYPDDPKSDPGFHDLTPEEYILYRLEDQLNWHEKKIVEFRNQSRNFTIVILAVGALGALFAAIGSFLTVWVALTAAVTTALTGWEELRNLDQTIANYSKVKLELNIIREYWLSLPPEEQTETAFFKLVQATENILWVQNAEYIKSMQEALASALGEEANVVEEMVQLSEKTTERIQAKLLDEAQLVMTHTAERLEAVAETSADMVKGMVTSITDEAIAAQEAVREAVRETVTEEAAATRKTVEASMETVAQEVQAGREMVQETVGAETAAARETLEDSLDAVTDETAAIRETVESGAEMLVDEGEAIRESIDGSVDKAAGETAAIRKTIESAVDEAMDESAAVRGTVEKLVDSAIEEAESTRKDLERAIDELDKTVVVEIVEEAIEGIMEDSSPKK